MGCGVSKKPPDEPVDFQQYQKPDGALDRDALLKMIFVHCDDNDSGFVSMREFQQLALKQDPKALQMQNKVFACIDSNGDGKISIEEFMRYNMREGENLTDIAFNKQARWWLEVCSQQPTRSRQRSVDCEC